MSDNTTLDHESRISKCEIRLDAAEEKIDKLDSIDKAVTKISIFFERFQEDAEKREQQRIADAKANNEQIQSITNTLASINTNITGLNKKTEETQSNLHDLETKVDGQICELQNQITKSEDKNIVKIDLRDKAKSKWTNKYTLPVGIGGSILGALALLYEFLKLIKVL